MRCQLLSLSHPQSPVRSTCLLTSRTCRRNLCRFAAVRPTEGGEQRRRSHELSLHNGCARYCGTQLREAKRVSATEGFILRSDAAMSCAVIARIALALVVSAATPSSRIGREGRTHVRVLIESVRMSSVTMLSAWRLALVSAEGCERTLDAMVHMAYGRRCGYRGSTGARRVTVATHSRKHGTTGNTH